MSYRLGIDLGTTYTAAAVNRDGVVTMSPLGGQSDAVPSLVLIREDGTVLVGDAAEYRGLSEPERLAREFKRRIGDTTPILVGGSPYSAESLTGRLLRWVVDQVAGHEGGPADEVVVTHPANWGPYKIELLGQAVQLAGLDDVHMLTEPEAAAIYYAGQERVEPGSIVAVYDLGGGTFDAAVLRKTETGFEVLGAPKGVERLGGIDFDAAVYGHVARALAGELDHLDEDDPAAVSAVARLRSDCVLAKETLSSDTDVTIAVMLPDTRTEIRLTRAEFETMIRPPLVESVGALRLAIDSADIDAADVTTVLLVGGSSRIPLVAQLVGAELDRPVSVDTHPKNSIARGAAMHDPTPIQESEPAAATTEAEPVAAAVAASETAASESAASEAEPEAPDPEPPEAPPPATPPPGPAPGSPASNGGRPRAWWKIAVPVVTVVAIVAAMLGFILGSGDEASAGEVLLEPITSVGIDPFTPTVDTEPDPEPIVAIAEPVQAVIMEAAAEVEPPTEVPVVIGTDPGLYGGTRDGARCDALAMIAFLTDNPDKAAAWADAQDIDVTDLSDFILGLTPAVLQADTRVTNHGFKNGRANPIQSVLQAGTAVLVDESGVPRARCACGNPLEESATPSAEVSYTGTAWDGFEEAEVVAVEAGDSVDELVLTDTSTGEEFVRPVGSSGEADADVAADPATDDESAADAADADDSTPEEVAQDEPEEEEPIDDRKLLDQGSVTLSASSEITAFVANPAGEEFGVLLEGSYDVTVTFETGGGSASGTVTGSMSGVSVGAETLYSANFSGTLSGSYDPRSGAFEGSISWSGTTTPGVESSLPNDPTWTGTVHIPPGECARGTPAPCVFGASNPEVDVIWEMGVPAVWVNPDAR